MEEKENMDDNKFQKNNKNNNTNNKERYISKSENETINIAKTFASTLAGNETIILTGNLGSGKTKFVEGFMQNWEYDETSSPTFTIVNEYDVSENQKIYHIDAYRLNDAEDFFAIGADEFLEDNICLIEWGENIIDAITGPYIHINVGRKYDLEDNSIREIEIEYISY